LETHTFFILFVACLIQVQYQLGFPITKTMATESDDQGPLTEAFDKRVIKVMAHFHTPDLPVSVIDGKKTFEKVDLPQFLVILRSIWS
jgi:hypothetical protein